MKNKKGNLMDNALGVLIAVIGLALLAYGVYKVYQTVVNSENENAKKTIDSIESKINALQDGQTGDFSIVGIKGWYLGGWNLDIEGRPEKCSLKSCICICKLGNNPSLSSACQENGFCRSFDAKEVYVYISGSVRSEEDVLSIIRDRKGYDIQFGCIKLGANLLELKVEKSKDIIKASNPSKDAFCTAFTKAAS